MNILKLAIEESSNIGCYILIDNIYECIENKDFNKLEKTINSVYSPHSNFYKELTCKRKNLYNNYKDEFDELTTWKHYNYFYEKIRDEYYKNNIEENKKSNKYSGSYYLVYYQNMESPILSKYFAVNNGFRPYQYEIYKDLNIGKPVKALKIKQAYT